MNSLRFLSLTALVVCGLTAQVDPAVQVKSMGRGVNILGYDPLWSNAATARFQERHFKLIHDGGFQSVRVNLQAFSHMDAQNQLDPGWLKTLDWVVKNALASNLTVILDEHDFTYCADHADACETKLLAFWQQVGEIYKDAPPSVIFEILNEPNGQLTPARWNAVMKEALAVIRKTNPTRNVVIGGAMWNSTAPFILNSLQLPEDDRNIIVTVHYYQPMTFTHQGASWSPATVKLSGVTWGTDTDKLRVVKDLVPVQEWSNAHHRPILLGEFGAYDKGPTDSRTEYTSWVARLAESLGWAWTYWQFDSDFIAWDMEKDGWVEPIHKALVP